MSQNTCRSTYVTDKSINIEKYPTYRGIYEKDHKPAQWNYQYLIPLSCQVHPKQNSIVKEDRVGLRTNIPKQPPPDKQIQKQTGKKQKRDGKMFQVQLRRVEGRNHRVCPVYRRFCPLDKE